MPTPAPTPAPKAKAKSGAIHPFGAQPPDDTDADLDAEEDGNKAAGCIELHRKLHELDLNTIYSDWTGWMVPALGLAAVLDVTVYYFLDRGGLFRPTNVIDPDEAGVSTVVDPREFFSWLTATVYALAAGKSKCAAVSCVCLCGWLVLVC